MRSPFLIFQQSNAALHASSNGLACLACVAYRSIRSGPSRILLALALALTCTAWSASAEKPPPNILILLGDDIDRDSLGPWGGQAKTPHLDRLAVDGIRFDRVYANVAMCAPFRQELYSGRSAWRTRALPNHSRSVEGTRSLPHYLRPLGYRVGLLGKSHVGPKECYPFDKVGSLPMKEDANPLALKLAREYVTTARDAGDPFCLVVASHDGHGPYTNGDVSAYDVNQLKISEDAIGTPSYRQQLAKHLAEITHLDALLGDLRAMLDEEKLSTNTLVIFCSEQGNAFPFSKWTCYDDGLASGVVAALPGVIKGNTSCDKIFWIADVAPTLLEAAGGTIDDAEFDGKSQWGNFKGEKETIHQYAYGAFTNCRIIDNVDRVYPIRSIRDDRYTLIWAPLHDKAVTSNTSLTQALAWVQDGKKPKGKPNTAGTWVEQSINTDKDDYKQLVHRFHHLPEWALYDRQSDPEELINRVNDPELFEVTNRLKKNLLDWLEQGSDSDPVATERGFLGKK